jgi:hypothetical protein
VVSLGFLVGHGGRLCRVLGEENNNPLTVTDYFNCPKSDNAVCLFFVKNLVLKSRDKDHYRGNNTNIGSIYRMAIVKVFGIKMTNEIGCFWIFKVVHDTSPPARNLPPTALGTGKAQ